MGDSTQGKRKTGEGAGAELQIVPLDWASDLVLPEEVEALLSEADAMLQAYWDQWHRRPIEQYVACDFRDVYRAMLAIDQQKIAPGKLFCEWGCGFGIVTALAAGLGWDAVGIEAEAFLVQRAKSFIRQRGVSAEIWQGNFLPEGAERLAKRQANHASLFHQVPSVYEEKSLEVDDFSIIFAYPWPGEDYFLKDVFLHYAADQAILLMFLGPYEIEVYRKQVYR